MTIVEVEKLARKLLDNLDDKLNEEVYEQVSNEHDGVEEEFYPSLDAEKKKVLLKIEELVKRGYFIYLK